MKQAVVCRALSAAFFCALSGLASAQSISSSDANEWSSFRSSTVQGDRAGPMLDTVFQDVRRDGPWSRSEEAALSSSESKLLALLQGGQWRDALSWLKAHQPDLNRRDEIGRTPLTMAVEGGQLELVREMIKRGADLDQAGASGMTPLTAAVFAGHEIMVRDLVRQGARLDQPNVRGQLPLHLACAAGRLRLVSYLMDQGADWQLPNKQGRHAVAEAAYFGQEAVLQLLKDRGADLAALDVHRLNAMHAAALGEQRQTLTWLRERGVPVNHVLTQVLIDQLDSPVSPTTP